MPGPIYKVVIVGGGFAGLNTALGIRNAAVNVTLVDRRNFHSFQPLLYQVATGALSPASGSKGCPPLASIRGPFAAAEQPYCPSSRSE
jgi:NADH dehydrogenase FAD-containing subunit